MHIHILQHVPFEGPGSIAAWALEHGHRLSATPVYEQQSFPEVAALDWLIVMGGPMGVGDEDIYSWLRPEKAFIGRAIAAGKVVLGICLGAQLMAEVLGARVYANREKEIGWFPISREAQAAGAEAAAFLPEVSEVFHWHGDTFDLPVGAQRLASSAACLNQGFIYRDQVVGLQFHLETTAESLEALIANCGNEIKAGPYIQSEDDMRRRGRGNYARINSLMAGLLDRLAGVTALSGQGA